MIDNFIYNSLFSFFTAFIITAFTIPTIIQVAKAKRLFDFPDPRKLHAKIVPTLGGTGVFLGFICAMTFWTNFVNCGHLQYVLTSLIIISVIGIKDDLVGLSPFKKAIGQVVAATIVVVFGKLHISYMYNIFGISDLPETVSIIFTIFTIFVITNAYNLIDGIDGLAGSLGIVASVTFGILFLLNGDNNQQAVLAFALAGALLAFLWFNITPAKIFMGDTGSMLIGFILAYLSIEFLEFTKAGNIAVYKSISKPMITMSVLFVPLYDLVRVFSIRIFKRRSPFKPDQNHFHHMLLMLGFSHIYATIIISLFSILLIILALAFQNLGNYWIGLILLVTCLLFTFVLFVFIKKRGVKSINGK